MGAFVTAVRAGYTAFKSSYQSTAIDSLGVDQYGRVEARNQRYRLYEALWENTAYDGGAFGLHKWAQQFKASRALYRYTRGVYNPSYRLIEFWATHLMGGSLDRAAGDGIDVPSALPIGTDNPEIRPAIAQLWRDSFWEANKSVWGRQGAMLGDAVLGIDIDMGEEWVAMKVIHPRTVPYVAFDRRRRVTYYHIQEVRPDPTKPYDPMQTHGDDPPTCLYEETCERTNNGVRYRTFRDGKPFNWRGAGTSPVWEAPWPFVPMVCVKHLDIGLDFGVSELHAAVTKAAEADDAGSKVNDHVRRTVEAPWFYAGVRPNDLDAAARRRAAESTRPQPGREEVLSITATDPQARAQALVAALNIEGVSIHVGTLIDSLERDYPEMRYDRIKVSGDASAKALREAAKAVKTKVTTRRVNYDDCLVTAQKMGIAIGGELGFPGYEGYGLSDWETDRLDHTITSRPIFDVEDIDRIEEDTAEATAAEIWKNAGVPIQVALKRAGWPEDLIAEVVRINEDQFTRAMEMARVRGTPEGNPAEVEE